MYASTFPTCPRLPEMVQSGGAQDNEPIRLLAMIGGILHNLSHAGKEGSGRRHWSDLWGRQEDEVERLHKGGREGQVALVFQDAAEHGEHCPAAQPGSQLAHHQAPAPLQQPRASGAPKPVPTQLTAVSISSAVALTAHCKSSIPGARSPDKTHTTKLSNAQLPALTLNASAGVVKLS